MSGLEVRVDPAELGFDAARLERIDRRLGRYVDDGLLAGWQVVVARDGEVADVAAAGARDAEAGLPVEADTIWRIYSMSKPVTAVAAMTLWEEGAFELKDPVSKWIPAFAESRVWAGGSAQKPVTAPLTEPVRMWHLLTHTAGLTYGFHHAHPVDTRYREAGFEFGTPPGLDLAACCERWAALPLLHQPGAEWNYSVATDVLGRVIEVISGGPLDAFLTERVLGPLGMTDTGFWADGPAAPRLAQLYSADPSTGRAVPATGMAAAALRPPDCLSGGGGLLSTAADYLRFCHMVLGGGELDGARLLGPRTLRFMGRNHLPGGADLESCGRELFAETTFTGVGFGLGWAVTLDPVANKVPSSAGELHWGGAASTAFWIDPAERLAVVLMTQLMPSTAYPLRSQLRQLVHQALVD